MGLFPAACVPEDAFLSPLLFSLSLHSSCAWGMSLVHGDPGPSGTPSEVTCFKQGVRWVHGYLLPGAWGAGRELLSLPSHQSHHSPSTHGHVSPIAQQSHPTDMSQSCLLQALSYRYSSPHAPLPPYPISMSSCSSHSTSMSSMPPSYSHMSVSP